MKFFQDLQKCLLGIFHHQEGLRDVRKMRRFADARPTKTAEALLVFRVCAWDSSATKVISPTRACSKECPPEISTEPSPRRSADTIVASCCRVIATFPESFPGGIFPNLALHNSARADLYKKSPRQGKRKFPDFAQPPSTAKAIPSCFEAFHITIKLMPSLAQGFRCVVPMT